METGFDKQEEANAIVRENPHLSTQEKQTLFIKKFKDHAELIKFGTALGAFSMGRDVNLAHKIASNALDHNAIPLVIVLAPELIALAEVALAGGAIYVGEKISAENRNVLEKKRAEQDENKSKQDTS